MRVGVVDVSVAGAFLLGECFAPGAVGLDDEALDLRGQAVGVVDGGESALGLPSGIEGLDVVGALDADAMGKERLHG